MSSELNLIQVEVEAPDAEPLRRARASLTGFSARNCSLRTDDVVAPLARGSTVVLRLVDRRAMEIVGVIERHSGHDMDLVVTRVNHQEKRYFPREFGGIDVRWKRVEGPDNTLSQAWRRGLHTVDPDGDDWQAPEPFMNFSASGLRFRATARCDEGDHLLVAFRLPDGSDWHRATAQVVRVDPTLGRDGSEIAVAFDDIDTDSVRALADFTLDRQLVEFALHGLAADDV